MSKNDDRADPLAEWDLVLSAASRLQSVLPGSVLVGGTASALYAGHRLSRDADHVIADLQERFDKVLGQLESVAGWKTARVKRPVMILGSLDGIETGIRQLIRSAPLETRVVEHKGAIITVPTEEEMLRIKAVLILKRNATRDYLDFVALGVAVGDERVARAMESFDRLYPQPSGESALQQLQAQLSHPMPYDLKEVELAEYKNLDPTWHDWNQVAAEAAHLGGVIFDRAAEAADEQEQPR
jgi:hypothetical protein